MSAQYDLYLEQHRMGVEKAFKWLYTNIPVLFDDILDTTQLETHICYMHDNSKNKPDEYEPYDSYFYGGHKSTRIENEFNLAWLKHIHRNPHHWQYWVLTCDDKDQGTILIDMPYDYIIEMICDWWSFSHNSGNLYAIFDWYKERKEYIKLSDKTRETVEYILGKIKLKLDEDKQQ